MNILPSEKLTTSFAPLLPVYNCAGIFARQAQNVFDLWKAWEAECGQECDVPFWAVVWPGAVALASHVLSHPEIVEGKKVLDFGCGGGIAGIAAAKAGAQQVVSNDIDPAALHITHLNARANHVTIHLDSVNLLNEANLYDYDSILAADMFYHRSQSEQTAAFLKKQQQNGSYVLIADGERPFAPKEGIQILKEEIIPVNFDLEGIKERRVKITTFLTDS
jgi:predicted nicotinamide N-methyase